jgi:hypothetical protein
LTTKKLTPEHEELTARREFLSRVGKAATTAPAIALLLAASSQTVSAQYGAQHSDGFRERQ